MLKREKFERDLDDGELGEKLIAKFLQTKGFIIIGFNKNIDYDILTSKNDKKVLFEVKTDRYEKYKGETGNMFIEVRCNGKMSGIMATKADYFVYFYPEWELAYIIKVDELKELIKRPDLFWRAGGSGDDEKVVGMVCKRNEVKDYFKIYKIEKSELWNKK